jgi:hypothetical protein
MLRRSRLRMEEMMIDIEVQIRRGRKLEWQKLHSYPTREAAESAMKVLKNPTWPHKLRIVEKTE